ncbi:MAG TPA: NAD(P)-dependent alcohol dehydrogenase [Polyangiaceae bacterium]|nr:NAD(P)-dependent alcohol dehydrogenase [Polyangiaceae bacterium]
MRRYEIREPKGIGSVLCHEVEAPRPGPGQVLVEMKAWSLNYRDLAMPRGGYPGNDKVLKSPPLVPLSDGAGEVVGVGPGVTSFALGDRVVTSFFQNWGDGELGHDGKGSALGGGIDGVLAERVVLAEQGLVAAPPSLSFEQAATLPCAGVTAWAALTGAPTAPGQNVLLLGTGGVSIFGLQLAKAMGCRAIITSSSAAKLERARQLGADETINYSLAPEWDREVLRLTGGVGVDNVLEVGGLGTLERSIRATRVSGTISLIGVLASSPEHNPSPLDVMFKRQTMRGIYVGSRRMLEDLCRAVEVNRITPVIDRSFGFDAVQDAYRYLKSGQHFGKVVITR